MASGSRIDTNAIDEKYPYATGPNSTQGFRDNFASIKKNLDTAAAEITRLQGKYIDVSGDAVGFSSDLGNTDRPNVALRLTLADTGVSPGQYRNPRLTIDAKGRVLDIADGAGDFLAATGGRLRGDLAVDGDLTVSGLLAGRRLDQDGAVLDRLTGGRGLVLMTPAGLTHRVLEGADGLVVRDETDRLLVGLKGFKLAFGGGVTGSVRMTGFADTTVSLDLSDEALPRLKMPRFGAPLDMQGNPIANVGTPQHGYHVADRNYNDGRYLMGTQPDALGFVVGRGRGNESLTRTLTGCKGILVSNGDGLAGNPSVAARDFTLKLTGDVAGSAIVNGLGDTEIRVRLVSTWTKAELQENFLSSKGGVLDGDLVVIGNITAAGTVQGRNLAEDGVLLDSLRGGPGLLVQKPEGKYGRAILVGEDRQIAVANGDGMAGHPVIGLAPNPRLPGSGAVTVPTGTGRQRPAKPDAGAFRFNTTQGRFEGFAGERWAAFVTTEDLPGPDSQYSKIAGAAVAWDVSRARVLDLTLSRDTAVLGVSNIQPGSTYHLIVRQDAVGGWTLTFGDDFKFSGPREVTAAPNSVDIFEFFSDGRYLYGHLRSNYS